MTAIRAAREARLRRLANRDGLALQKSRARKTPHVDVDDLGGYRLVEPNRNWVIRGPKFDLDLDDVERFLNQ
jgi:hypothetical protein